MGRTLFFRLVLRKFSKLTKSKPIFSQCNIFTIKSITFSNLRFDFFSIIAKKSHSYQEQCSLYCSSSCFRVLLCTHYGTLRCFSTHFLKLKEIGVLRSVFPDYVISCDYVPSIFHLTMLLYCGF